MMKRTICTALVLGSVFCGSALQADEAHRPRLFAQFGEMVNTPDGMALDAKGDLYLSSPNFQDKNFPGVILRRCSKTGTWSVFTPALLHPETRAAGPMGIAFGPDGNLYYCDNQYFNNRNYKSRILRVLVADDGAPLRIEPVVENVKFANGIRFRGNDLFFTDTCFDLPGRAVGGVYRVPMSAFRERPARLLPKDRAEKDPFFLGAIETQVLKKRNDPAAADGLCLAANGDLYTGSFGCGNFYKLARRPDGTYEKPKLLLSDPSVFSCCDGICYYEKKNWIIMADSAKNAIRYWDIGKEWQGAAAAFGTLWENDDVTGEDGLLDQPCEVLVFEGNKLLVANFDLKFPDLKNTSNDRVHTISVIDL